MANKSLPIANRLKFKSPDNNSNAGGPPKLTWLWISVTVIMMAGIGIWGYQFLNQRNLDKVNAELWEAFSEYQDNLDKVFSDEKDKPTPQVLKQQAEVLKQNLQKWQNKTRSPYAEFIKGGMSLSEGELNKAEQYYDQALKSGSKNEWVAKLALAALAEDKGQLDKAQQIYHDLGSSAPGYLQSYLLWQNLRLAIQKGNIAQAKPLETQLLTLLKSPLNDKAPALDNSLVDEHNVRALMVKY